MSAPNFEPETPAFQARQMPDAAAALSKRNESIALGKDNLLGVLESILGPLALVISLWGVSFYFEGEIAPLYMILSLLVFALTFPGPSRLQHSYATAAIDILLNWSWFAGLLLLTGFATGYLREFPHKALLTWLWLAPVSEFAAWLILRAGAPALLKLQGPLQHALIVGMNAQGVSLATKLTQSPYARIQVCGFADSRSDERISTHPDYQILGKLSEMASLVKTHDIHLIYLSLPMASQPRILQVLDALKDTTVSIYFVPDMFITDLIQGHTTSVCGVPIISVCESPFAGFDGSIKRLSDIVLSLLILILLIPVLIGVALAVKLSSPGPIIFKQRRYGQDGKEILVYKFRSMTVTEDGATMAQAQKNDSRITRLGAFMRRTSIDELPQFVNVLQGRMSIVGPRPHAVAHNELYRKLIKGYMVRHKVRPGITGWAQVNGLRGETDKLEKMQRRIDYDLDYLRNWSLRLDIHIILKTIRLVIKDQQAY